MPFSEIVTERLLLRELTEEDAERIFGYRSMPEVARFQSWGTSSRDEITAAIARTADMKPGMPGSWYQIGIVLRSSAELVGDCGFHVPEGEPRQAEVGIALSPEYQSRGYATEALRALLEYLFVRLGTHRVYGSVDPRNTRSIRLLQRIGMRKEAHLVESVWFKGEWVDDVILAMLAREWRR
jgi:RimJ/RimL family protein N-acetyltransferase